jgi:hypothetical protein
MFEAFKAYAGLGGQVSTFVIARDAKMRKAAGVPDLIEVCLHLSTDGRVFRAH